MGFPLLSEYPPVLVATLCFKNYLDELGRRWGGEKLKQFLQRSGLFSFCSERWLEQKQACGFSLAHLSSKACHRVEGRLEDSKTAGSQKTQPCASAPGSEKTRSPGFLSAGLRLRYEDAGTEQALA